MQRHDLHHADANTIATPATHAGPAHTSDSHQRHTTRAVPDTAIADTTALGYDTQWTCLRACDAGSCHRRDRIFILAHQPAAGAVPAAADGPGRRRL
jgi:site-specific DNA-cytosine methylase